MRNFKRILIGASFLLLISAIIGCDNDDKEGSDYMFSCRYVNQHSDGDECVEYRGDWTLEQATEDCHAIFSFLDETTADVSTVSCDLETECIGSCIVDRPEDNYIVTRYYEPVDAELLASFCVNPDFADGVWETGCDGNAASPQELSLEQAGRDAMVSNDQVTVVPECVDDVCESAMADAGEWIEFSPADATPTGAFVIYPGGGVDARAYAPTAQEIARKGILTIIVPMPGKFALDAYDRITDVIRAHPEIADWHLGGHSLGGVAATQYESTDPGTLTGLILWAAYGSVEYDIVSSSTPVTVIHGTEDGLATMQDVKEGEAYLPAHTKYITLEGANHAQFGYYGEQAGDGEATINKEKQQQLVVEFTLEAIERGLEND